MEVTNFDLLYSLFNQYVFQDAKNNIESLEYYFSTNPSTMSNPLVEELLKAIRNYSFDSIGYPLFNSILSKCRKTPAESKMILDEVIKWKKYTKDQILPAKKYLEDICASAIIRRANSMYKDSPSEYLKYLKTSTYTTSDINVFSSVNFCDIDINSMLADNPNDFIPSRYGWINDSFNPYPGYEKGQMVLVCAPPGVGKSLWLMSEALFMSCSGYKTLYVGLGDNKMKDFVIRMGAIFTGESFADVHKNLGPIYKLLFDATRRNLEISINKANGVSAEEIVEYALAKDFDVIVVDYDGNLKGVEDGDKMYSTYGIVYATLNELVLAGKLLFIASQPKINAWGNSVIEMQDIGESSRKQHSADFILGIGREVGNPNHLHTFKISKSRRGETDVIAYTIRLNNGRFKELPKDLYDSLKEVREKKTYTEKDIDMMIDQFTGNVRAIQQNLQIASGVQQQVLQQQQIEMQQQKLSIKPGNPFSM